MISGKIPEKKQNHFTPMTFAEVSDSLKLEWIGRNKRKKLADKTLYEYNVRINLVCQNLWLKDSY